MAARRDAAGRVGTANGGTIDSGAEPPLQFLPEPGPRDTPSPTRPSDRDAGVTDSGTSAEPLALCRTAPDGSLLIGRRGDEIIGVDSDGSARVVAAAGDAQHVRREHGWLVLLTEGADSFTVLWLDPDGRSDLGVEVENAGDLWYPPGARIEPDGTVVIGGSGGRLRIGMGGELEREDPRESDPVQSDRYFWVAEADEPGWHVVSIRSNVVPLALAFYHPVTDTLQEVRHRSDWVPQYEAEGRIVYLGHTAEGPALIDEGVAEANATALEAAYPRTTLRRTDERILVEHDAVPVASLDQASREVTVLSEPLTLLQGGARATAGALAILSHEGAARWVVDRSSLESRSLDGLDLPPADTFRAEGDGQVLLLGDGRPVLWVDREGDELDLRGIGGDELGLDPAESGPFETLFTSRWALAVEEGFPVAVIELETGDVERFDSAARPTDARTHAAGERFLVTGEGRPLAVAVPDEAVLSWLGGSDELPAFERVITAPGWAVGTSGAEPLWRVDLSQIVVEPFAASVLPLSGEFYGADWHESVGDGAEPPLPEYPHLVATGEFVTVRRDDARAAAYALTPAMGLHRLGDWITSVDWITTELGPHTWLVAAGPAQDCFCTWPTLKWSSESQRDALGESIQLLPLASLDPIVFEGAVSLRFDSSESCVLVRPSQEPHQLIDLTTGARTPFDAFETLIWLPNEAATAAF